MALPGGRRERHDEPLAEVARRETREEVGVDLATPLGRLDDIGGRLTHGTVATFVFHVDERPELELDTREVQDALWLPLRRLLDDDAQITYRYRGIGGFPAVAHGEKVVWGLTFQILTHFLEITDLT